MLARIWRVVLHYHVVPRGSRSFIRDNERQIHPLLWEWTVDKNRYIHAIKLLNMDIMQLLAIRGIESRKGSMLLNLQLLLTDGGVR
eukprot:gene10996-9604_t